MRSKVKFIKQCVVSHDSLKSLIAFLFLSAQLVFGESAQHDETDLPITPIQVGTPERIEVSPSEFTISGPRDRLQLVITGHYANGEIADLTRAATLKFSSQGIAEAGERSTIKPLSDGETNVAVSVGDCTTSMSLNVTNQKSKEPVSFYYEALPALSKAGCAAGGCHGAPHGKGEFRLSLWGFDPVSDQYTIINEEFGRRVNLIEPEKSLLLAKPRNDVAHEGGLRLRDSDIEHEVLVNWIKSGCHVEEKAPRCTGIRLTPGEDIALNRPHHTQQFRVVAMFDDGSSKDITHLASYESSDEKICRVSRHGLAVGMGRGEAAVIVRYLEYIQSTIVSFVEDVPGLIWETETPANYVDELIYAKLEKFKYLPSGLSSDSEFFRRVHLDLTGLLPTPVQVSEFLDSSVPDKRSKLIDELLETEQFALFWTQKWGDVLKLSARQMGHGGVVKFHRWIRDSVASNQPYDEFAKEILLATGSNLITPTSNFYRSGSDTSDIMESTAQLFLGTRIGCAKCHNHPYEPWTQDSYYGLSAFFNRIETRKTGRKGEIVVWMNDEGDVRHPVTDEIVEPWVPGSHQLDLDSELDRRKAFVEWLTGKDNPFFAKVEVNRIWAQLMGRGIVEPFDDLRDTNPAANQPLLDALTADFVEHDFNRKHIIRTIVNSRTYQASSKTNQWNKTDYRYFSRYYPRRLTAEQLIDALSDLTGIRENFASVSPGIRATQLPAPDLKKHDREKIGDIEFLKVFGMPERQTVCECERGDDSSLGQALELFNGRTLHGMLSDQNNRFHLAYKKKQSTESILTDLYLRAFSREPNDEEKKIAVDYFNNAKDKGQALEDIVWVAINRDEFLFQY